MNDSQLRALIGVILYITDSKNQRDTPDWYMGQAQRILESSYKNYQPPTGGDQQEVDRAMSLLVTKGYAVVAPGFDLIKGVIFPSDVSTPPPLPAVSEQPPST